MTEYIQATIFRCLSVFRLNNLKGRWYVLNNSDWNALFGEDYLISLTNDERKYFALNELKFGWEYLTFYSKTNLWYTRVIAFFEGNAILKVISETKKVVDGIVVYDEYSEYDTELMTDNRVNLLPLTSRGKPKPLTASNINNVTPFGCRLSIIFTKDRDTDVYLRNLRANKNFPLGEDEKISKIKSDADFHSFTDYYISTCSKNYFEKIKSFKNAKKVTVKYKPGDIFRMEYDRNHYCYGLITGEIRNIKKFPELPEKHSLRQLMMVPIMVRLYNLLTEDADLTAKDLEAVSLGRVLICGDNDIIWGTHDIVDHKVLDPSDFEFNFVCTKIISENPHHTLFTEDMFLKDGLLSQQPYSLYIEWGFAQTKLEYNDLSDKLKQMLSTYSSPHGGVLMGIDPNDAIINAEVQKKAIYRNNLLNPENRGLLNEIFSCLGMKADSSFDEFANKFGGLTLAEIAERI